MMVKWQTDQNFEIIHIDMVERRTETGRTSDSKYTLNRITAHKKSEMGTTKYIWNCVHVEIPEISLRWITRVTTYSHTHAPTSTIFQSISLSLSPIVPLWIATTITKGSPVESTCSSHSLGFLFSEINLYRFSSEWI